MEDSGISDSTSESSIDIPSKYVQAVNTTPCDGESYYVWGEVSRDAPKALFVIDTGAQVSIINKKLYDSIPAYDKPELKKTDGTFDYHREKSCPYIWYCAVAIKHSGCTHAALVLCE